jgi:hypothetical protein
MEGTRIITIIVDLDSRKLGGSMLLLPFEVRWLESNTCAASYWSVVKALLKHVLVENIDRHTALATVEVVNTLL